MTSVSYATFKANIPSSECNDIVGDEWEESVANFEAADFLHEIYCNEGDCEYMAEEELLSNPWSGADHDKWLGAWETLNEAGVTLTDAVNAYNEIVAY